MGVLGYFAYRYKRKYYRQVLRSDVFEGPYCLGHGLRLASTVPRNPADFKEWLADRITMLENAKTYDIDNLDDEVVHPEDGIGADDLGFNTTYDLEWTFTRLGYITKWTYVIDLDNLVFTIDGIMHLRLDNLPPDLSEYSYTCPCGDAPVPREYISSRVNLWPAPNFDPEEGRRKYETLQPIIVPATEWGAPTWGEMSVSQRFSIEMTHYLLSKTSHKFILYGPAIRDKIGRFCWNILCASVPALPILQQGRTNTRASFRNLSCGWTNGYNTLGPHVRMLSLNIGGPKSLGRDYFWIRGCLITFCTHLHDPIYVAHEVEHMVSKMRHDGHPESVGIILSTQMELIVVAVDGSQTRHSPVLDIRATRRSERPGKASDGRLLLTYLLSPPLTVSPLPWRVQSHQPRTIASKSITSLPPEVLHMIIGSANMRTYICLCRVSRVIRSVCVANPRVGRYTILHRIPGFATIFAARHTNDHTLKTIKMQWKTEQWEFREIAPEELDALKTKGNAHQGNAP